jgi:phage regulator Rha-like protein
MPTRKHTSASLLAIETIERRILILRGHRVMLDRDLADLFGVETRALNQAVKRNCTRFPEDFMFQLAADEADRLVASRSQSVILNRGANAKYRPYAFTEHGTVMLANVLKSTTAVRASIQVVRAFVNLRRVVAAHDDLTRSIERLERRVNTRDFELQLVLSAVKKLLEPPPLPLPPKRRIGFLAPARTSRPA